MSLGPHRTQGGEDENFSALTLSLLVAGDVLSWRGKVDCSIASWTEWHCLHSLSLTPPPPPVRARSPSSSLHACWQHKLHSSAVFPHCRSRSCMSSAYLSGMGLLKGNATSRVSVCAHPQSALFSSLPSSAPPPPPCNANTPENHRCKGLLKRETPTIHTTLHPLLFIFTLQQKPLWDMSVLKPHWRTVCSIERTSPLECFETCHNIAESYFHLAMPQRKSPGMRRCRKTHLRPSKSKMYTQDQEL